MNLPTQKYSTDLRRYYRLPAVQISLTLVLSLFVIAIFITLALRPTIISIATLQKTITESRKTLNILDTKVANLQTASIQLETIKPYLPNLYNSIPNTGAMYSPLNAALEGLSVMSKVKLESESLGPTLLFSRVLSPLTPSKNQSVVLLPFSVRVTGSYPAISAFLKNLLSMERIVMVESVAIVKEAGKNEVSIVSLNVSGSAYYLANEAQLEQAMVETKGNN